VVSASLLKLAIDKVLGNVEQLGNGHNARPIYALGGALTTGVVAQVAQPASRFG
jgi:hypothetical protein